MQSVIRHLFLIAIFLSMAGCDDITSNAGPTPPIPYFGITPRSPRPIWPRYLDCTVIPYVTEGMVWGPYQIGVTTYDNMLEILAPIKVEWNSEYGFVEFINENSAISENPAGREYISAEACFFGAKLSALETYPHEYISYVQDWVREYGEPDIVTWAYFYEGRSMIWAEEGFLLVVDHELVEKVILFPPIPADELVGSWLMDAMPQENVSPPPSDFMEE